MALRTSQVLGSGDGDVRARIGLLPPRAWLIALGVAVLLVICLLAGGFFHGQDEEGVIRSYVVRPRSFPIIVREKGELKSIENIEIKCEVEGESTVVELVDEGTRVEKGDLLLRLNSDELIDRIDQAKLDVAPAESEMINAEEQLKIQESQNGSEIKKSELARQKAETELEKYQQGDYTLQLQQKQVAVQKAERNLERARINVASKRRLFDKNYVSQLDLSEAEKTHIEQQTELAVARGEMDIFKRYTHPQAQQEREAALEEAQRELQRVRLSAASELRHKTAELRTKQQQLKLRKSRLKKLEENLAKTEIRAPTAGLVVYPAPHRWSDESDLVVGKRVNENQILMRLPDLSAMKAVIAVKEGQTSLVKVGQQAAITVEALDKTLSGKVSKIGVLANSNRWWARDIKEYATEITLDASDANLKPGMTVVVEIITGQVVDALVVPVTAIFALGDDTFVFIGRSGRAAERRPVKLGRSNNDFVEIIDGLESEEKVLRTYPGGLEELRRDQAQAEQQRQDGEPE